MENFIQVIESNPLYLAGIIFFCTVIIWTLLKKVIKFAAILFIAIIVYAGYLSYTGQEVPEKGKQALEKGSEQIEILRDKEPTMKFARAVLVA